MADLTGINVFLNSDDVDDVSISSVGDGTYELRIGDFIITTRSYSELKTLCLNVQSAFEKLLKLKLDKCKPPEETISAVNDNFKSILKVYGGAK